MMLSSLPILLAGGALLYFLARILYNLFLHPLARFPGPRLATATGWYEVYYDLLKAPGDGGRFCFEVERMHRVHGPIVRINPDELHVADPAWYDTWKPIGGAKRDKWPALVRTSNTHLGTFGCVRHEVHRPRKQVVTPFFSKRNIAAGQPVIGAQVDRLCELFRDAHRKAEVVTVNQVYLAFAIDVICELVLGMEEGLLLNPDKARAWKLAFASIFDTATIAIHFPWLVEGMQKLPDWLMAKISPSIALLLGFYKTMRAQGARHMREHHGGRTAEKKPSPSRRTVFDAILESDLPPPEKSLDRLEHEGREVIAAGSETTARMLTAATFFILATPGVLERLKSELKGIVAADGTIPDLAALERLPWLTAIIKEILRMQPIVSSRIPLVAPNDILRYGEWEIPAGTPVSMSTHITMLDPTLFPSPHTFRPERWLAADTRAMDHAFVPFGRGSRMCSGMNLSWAEIYLALAMIFGRFDLELHDTERARDIDATRDCFLGMPCKESQGVRVRVRGEI